MAHAFDLVLRHNAWANRYLLEFCSRLDNKTLDRVTAATYGTLLDTLQQASGVHRAALR